MDHMRRRIARLTRWTAPAVLAVLYGCAGDGRPGSTSNGQFDEIQRNIFDQHCLSAGCHNAQSVAGNLNLTTGVSYDQLVNVGELKPHPKNPNTHSAAQVAAIAAVIEGNGWRAPITVSNSSGFITRGHGRLEAALLLGCEQVPVDFQDYASEQAELADMLADNHLAELAEIDEGRLVGVLKELQAAGHDVGLAGFSEDEVARLTAVEEEIAQLEPIPKMELQAFEHYDYLVFMFKDIRDWLRVLQLLRACFQKGVVRATRPLRSATRRPESRS